MLCVGPFTCAVSKQFGMCRTLFFVLEIWAHKLPAGAGCFWGAFLGVGGLGGGSKARRGAAKAGGEIDGWEHAKLGLVVKMVGHEEALQRVDKEEPTAGCCVAVFSERGMGEDRAPCHRPRSQQPRALRAAMAPLLLHTSYALLHLM